MKRQILASTAIAIAGVVFACGSDGRDGFQQDDTPTEGPQTNGSFGDAGTSAGQGDCVTCSADGKDVITCTGQVIRHCEAHLRCGGGTCLPPCDAAKANKSSVGCDYYAKAMLGMGGSFGGCFVAFVANTYDEPMHVDVSFGGKKLDVASFARIPKGSGKTVTYEPYDAKLGVPPNEVAILFLSHDPQPHGNWGPAVACPITPPVGLESQSTTGVSIWSMKTSAFHITTDRPIVAYQMMPFGGGRAATTGATLLLPTSAWDTNYIAAGAYMAAKGDIDIPPTTAIIAAEDGTVVRMNPKVAIGQGNGIPAGPAGVPWSISMNAGEAIELVQTQELTGSPIQSTKPIAVIAGHMGLRIPADGLWSDHAEQQIPPIKALGSEYAAAGPRDRWPGAAEKRLFRIVGAAAGTKLAYDPPVAGAPSSIGAGEIAELTSDTPFVVKSQDNDHPFLFVTYMSGSGPLSDRGAPPGYGDADFVRLVPGLQYLQKYVFFTDPTYPETNLVVIRRKGMSGAFAPVKLDCLGEVSGFTPIGSSGTYELARVDLSRHDFQAQGKCDNGRHEMSSTESFGLYVWGWGTPETRASETEKCGVNLPNNTCDISYGYPAGENVRPINLVQMPVGPK